MPKPIFLVHFRAKHGRNPRPDELTMKQRRSILRCCIENIHNYGSNHELLEEFDRQIRIMKQHRQTLSEQSSVTQEAAAAIEDLDLQIQLMSDARDRFSTASPQYWRDLIQESVDPSTLDDNAS